MSIKASLNPLIAVCVVGLTACAHPAYKPPESLAMSPNEGIVVIGATDNVHPGFISGSVSDGVFTRDTITAEGFGGKASGGYLVGRLKATTGKEVYGLWAISTNRLFVANCGEEVATFRVAPGKIQYVTDFAFRDQGSSISYSMQDDLERATKYLRATYPGQKFEVVKAVVNMSAFAVPQGRKCGPLTITIYR